MFYRWGVVIRDLNDREFKLRIVSKHWTKHKACMFANELQHQAFVLGTTNYFTVERLP